MFRVYIIYDAGEYVTGSAGNCRPVWSMVQGGGEDELGDGEDGVAVVDEAGEDSGQRLRCVEGGVVEQHDAARLYLGGHPPADGVRVIILPVEGALSART